MNGHIDTWVIEFGEDLGRGTKHYISVYMIS